MTEPQPGPSARRLRSGKLVPSSATVSLRNYIQEVFEEARETENLTIPQLDALDKALKAKREERLKKAKAFEKSTEEFREELQNFNCLSRSLETNSSKLPGSVENILSKSYGPKKVDFDWLSVSLTESEDELITKNNNCKKKMADYAKVAKLLAQMVPIFNGDSSPTIVSDLQTFIGCCKRVINCISTEDKEAFLVIFPTRLRGPAYQLIATNQPESFEEAEKLLNQTYLPRETYQELVNKLIIMRQYPLEALVSFTSRVKQMLTLCKEAATQKYGTQATPAVFVQLEDFAKSALKSGSNNPHLCQYLITLTDESLDKLIQKALNMERLQQTIFHSPPFNPHLSQVYPYNPTPKTNALNTHTSVQNPHLYHYDLIPDPSHQTNQLQNTSMLTRIQEPIPSKTPHTILDSEKKIHTKNVICNFCKIRGHTYDVCLKRKNTPVCANCKSYGHEAYSCRRQQQTGSTQDHNPSRREYQSPSTSAGLNPKARVFQISHKCDFCGRHGHVVDECAQKQKWEKKQTGNGH